MALTPGDRLGHYRIVEQLGAGGMGEVYRAADTTLKRDVAIKILPVAFAADPERLLRFEREAQVLAQLNHPHIASIYGLHAENGIRFLAMELAPGETLEKRIERGPLPLDETVAIARKIADGLEFAHERGIVHRDLKPANVKITETGDVKILDFGLAKAITGEAMSGGPTSTPTIVPTITSVGTAIGIILGTAAYMSPEQARGRPVDKRADIWAFGAVLYEMLSGRRLFDGETVSDTIAAVLTRPVDTDALKGEAPPALRRLIARCLERDPKLRLRDIGEARIALDSAGAVEVQPDGAPAASPTRVPAATLLLVPIVLLGGLAVGWFLRTPPPVKTQAGRYALAVPNGMSLTAFEQVQVATSRDGKIQVITVLDAEGTSRLVARTDDAFESRVLPETERAIGPFISPDGAWVGFFRDNAMLKVPVVGGPPIPLATVPGSTRGAVWSTDGFIYLAAEPTSGLSRVPQGGGSLETVTKLDDARNERTHRWPDALPDGSAILYTSDDVASTEYYDDAHIEAIRPATKEHKVLIEGASMARFAPGGRLVFARGGSIFSVKLDPKTLTVSGVPDLVAQAVATDVGTGAVSFALAENGTAIWIPGSATASFQETWVDRKGNPIGAPIPAAPYNELALSPDGSRVALTGGQGGVSDLWVYDFARGMLTRLTKGEYVLRPAWTPDGTRIAYGTRVQGTKAMSAVAQIAMRPADGSRDATILFEHPFFVLPTVFTPDGKSLLFSAKWEPGGPTSLFELSLTEKAGPHVLIGGDAAINFGAVSPDRRWLVYSSLESGQSAVFVRPYPAGEGRWQIASSGREPRWSPNGKELFYRDGGALFVVPIDTRSGFSPGHPERVADSVASSGTVSSYGISPDGSRVFTFRSERSIAGQHTLYLDRAFLK